MINMNHSGSSQIYTDEKKLKEMSTDDVAYHYQETRRGAEHAKGEADDDNQPDNAWTRSEAVGFVVEKED